MRWLLPLLFACAAVPPRGGAPDEMWQACPIGCKEQGLAFVGILAVRPGGPFICVCAAPDAPKARWRGWPT